MQQDFRLATSIIHIILENHIYFNITQVKVTWLKRVFDQILLHCQICFESINDSLLHHMYMPVS